MASPVALGFNAFPFTLPTAPPGDNIPDILEQLLTVITQQVLASNSKYAVMYDNADNTKQILFATSAATTATATTIAASQTANRTITLPDATDTLAGIAATQTLTNKTLTNPVLSDGSTVGIGSVSGSVFGTASSKMSFFGAAAVVQQPAATELNAVLFNLGLTTTNSTTRPINVAALTVTDGSAINIGSVSGSIIGNASSKLGFFSSVASAAVGFQNVSGNAAVVTTAVTSASPYGFSTAAQATAIITLVNAIRTALTNYNL